MWLNWGLTSSYSELFRVLFYPRLVGHAPNISFSLCVCVCAYVCMGTCVWAPGHVAARGQHGIISLIAHHLIVLGRLSHWTCSWLMQGVQQALRRCSLYHPRAEETRPHLAFTWVLEIEGRSLCLCSNYFTDWALSKSLGVISLSDILHVHAQQINFLHHYIILQVSPGRTGREWCAD